MAARWSTREWFVSPYNYVDEVRGQLELPDRVLVHDTTLRDGEQQPGLVFRKRDKVEIAVALDEAGVDRIEAGMPAVSREDAEAVKEVARQGLKATVMAFSRCLKSDVDLALRCDVPGVVMELPSSRHIIRYAYGWTEDKALSRAVEAVEYAKQHGLYVTFFTIDATRAELDFFKRVVEAVGGKMDSLTVADTFGVCTPYAISYFVRRVREFCGKPVEIHAHNDFGLAVANSLAAVASGASAVHVTVNGIGERCGNAPLEETVMALKLLLGVETNVKLEKLYELSKLVERLSGVRVPPQKPVTGDNAFRIESGIIAEWWLAVRDTRPTEVVPYLPQLVGRRGVELVLGKKSGKATVEEELRRLGVRASPEQVVAILEELKAESLRRKRALSREEFAEVVRRVLGAGGQREAGA